MCGHTEHKRRPRKKPEQLQVPYSDKGQKHTLGKKKQKIKSVYLTKSAGEMTPTGSGIK